MTSASSPDTPRARLRQTLPEARLMKALIIPLVAIVSSALIFSIFLLALGKSPVTFFSLVWTGGFSSWFSIQNAMQRAAPLILTGLAFAIPACIGLTLLGAEGALVLGGLTAAIVAVPLQGVALPALLILPVMALAAMAVGAIWMGIAGWLKHVRGVNETISSLLLTYIAIAIASFLIEGPFLDPGSANKPSTQPLGPDLRIGGVFGTSVHWGLAAGLMLASVLWVVMVRTSFGFATRIAGATCGRPMGRAFRSAA